MSGTFRTRWMFAGLALVSLQSCTWVQPDDAGAKVRVVYKGSLDGACEKRGEVTVSVKHEIVGIERGANKVRDELESLARNEAATLGADTIRAIDEPHDGEQRFGAFRCG
jgi:Domain of unknown function (DUF4156)